MNLLQYRARWSSPVTLRRFIHRRWAELGGNVPADSLDYRLRSAELNWGRSIGQAMAGGDATDLCELLNVTPVHANCEAAMRLANNLGCVRSSFSNDWVAPDSIVVLANGDVISRGEYNEYGTSCDECSDRYLTEDGITTEDGNTFCCDTCAERAGYEYIFGEWQERDDFDDDEEDDEGNGSIHSSCTYLGQLIGTGAKYNLGVEIEMEFGSGSNRDTFVKQLSSEFRTREAHCKNDGSLNRWGVEVVTGYGAWGDMLPVVRRICELSLKNGGKSHNTRTCGQHVTISRGEMSIAQQARFVVFFNHPSNQDIIKEFARRSGSTYANVRSSKGVQSYIDSSVNSNSIPTGDKFEMVNTNHRSHLELRACKGSLKWTTVMARLALLQLVATYCEQPYGAGQLLATDFLKWVAKMDTPEATSIKEYLVYRNQESLIAV